MNIRDTNDFPEQLRGPRSRPFLLPGKGPDGFAAFAAAGGAIPGDLIKHGIDHLIQIMGDSTVEYPILGQCI